MAQPGSATAAPARNRRALRWPASLTFPVVLFLIVTCFYWKLVFTYQFDWVWGPDLADQVLPWFDEELRQAHNGHFPLWDPHSWMGQPILGQAQPGAAYPLNWLLWMVPKQSGHIPMWAMQWYYVLIHYMAALFCFLLCRDLGRSRPASLIAGLVFSLTGYIGSTDWPQMLNGALWTPLVFLFLLRAVRGVRPWSSAVLSGAATGMAWLSGHHQAPIFITLASAGMWLYYTVRDRRIDWRIARLATVAMIFAPIVGALQILPAQEYGRLAWRWAGAADHLGWNDVVPYYVHNSFSLHPINLFFILIPSLSGYAPFVGAVAVSLALIAIAIFWREHFVKLLSAIALGGLVYALGGFSVFSGFLYAVIPFVEKARVATLAMLFFDIGVAALAAFGVDAILAARTKSGDADPAWLRRINLSVAAFAILLAAAVLIIFVDKRYNWDFDDRIVVTLLCAGLLALLLYAFRRGNISANQVVVLLAMLLLLEIGDQTGYVLADRNEWSRRSFIEKVWGNQDIAAYLHSQPGPFRVETATTDIVGNWGDYNDVDFVRAQAGVTVNAFKFENQMPQTQKLLGVKYVLSRTPTQPDQRPVFQGASGIVVYENPAPFPRAFAVHQAIAPSQDDDVRKTIYEDVDSLRTKAYVNGNLPKLDCAGAADTVAITRYEPSLVSIRTNMTCDGLLVLSDNYYPGWEARVDGRRVDIYEVDLALRSVTVPAGQHEVIFEYRPKSVYLGLTLTILGWIAAAVFVAQAFLPVLGLSKQ